MQRRYHGEKPDLQQGILNHYNRKVILFKIAHSFINSAQYSFQREFEEKFMYPQLMIEISIS